MRMKHLDNHKKKRKKKKRKAKSTHQRKYNIDNLIINIFVIDSSFTLITNTFLFIN